MAEERPVNDGEIPAPPQGQKAAESAALSNLSDAATESGSSTATNTAALGAALSNLSVGDGKTTAAASNAKTTTPATAPAKKVKIDQADVSFLVEHLELSKTKASQLLKQADGSRDKALQHFILPKTSASAA